MFMCDGESKWAKDHIHEGDSSGPSQSALKSAEGYVAASTGASRQSDGSGSQFSIAFRSLLEWGEKHNLILPSHDFNFLHRRPDGKGNEHEAWFDENTNRWLKATYENRFGLAWGKVGSASPDQYLKRLIFQNQ